MANYNCRNDHAWKGKSSLSPGFHPSETRCPECGEAAEPKMKQGGGRNGIQAVESPEIAEAHTRFSQLVTEWPCWAKTHRPGHRCWGPVDPHHLVPASWIRHTFSDLPDDELALILYEPVIGAPVCRAYHEALENRSEVIAWHELDDEAKLFCKRIDERYPGHQSMYERLKLESPVREAVSTDVA